MSLVPATLTLDRLPHKDVVHLTDIRARPHVFNIWERYRHRQAHWFVECVAESLGVFIYVYAGVGSNLGYVIGNIVGEPISSVLQIGFSYSLGILFALVTCASTSGGHFHPGFTISQVIYRGFPVKKACRYIVAQIFGAFIAALIVYVQWSVNIKATEAALISSGKFDTLMFTPSGVAGAFALYAPPGSNLGQVLLNEFVADFVIGLVIWACLDPTNFLVPPAAGPWVIALAYSMIIWGYSPVGVSANTARDLGGRFAALVIWGTPAAGGPYAAIAALTNIPATLVAGAVYEFVLTDSSRVIAPAQMDYIIGHLAHAKHSSIGASKPAYESELEKKSSLAPSASPSMSYKTDQKTKVEVEEA
ncbi:uncharacterized protein PHACADRAFT_209991 [Phanerochaete carnosa HHB-10118-sp]|uniref:Aquaporin-like protein n=1 Tax=Phanerochaete carnosa (strain HHB-10118-sp) TaxID=650164 RepID=K5W5E1_PHACS|nr:uncharacterized protein PHACADRAFT_209991 [Phanerochaete carnosa HHB-10118-sp]EKM54174.1 hypothetical protein PHACADRAFT_209991 [Phanerochaete carnosa HHB-10118-sp]